MTAFLVLGLVLAVLFLLSLVRLGGTVDYTGQGLLVRLRLGAFRMTVYPMAPKKEKKRREKKPKKPEEPVQKPGKGGSWDLLKRFLPLAAEAAGRFKRKVRIDRLDLDFTAAAADPAMAALAFGGANAAVGMMIPLFEHNFNVKERRIRTAVDFNATKPTVVLRAAGSLTVGQAVVLGVSLGWKALKILLDSRPKPAEKQKEAV